MELSLKGKKILITGAGAGIGLACAEAFVTAGADVAICDVYGYRKRHSTTYN